MSVFCLDVSSNKVTFHIQEQWNQKYSDQTTKEYGNLKQQMVEKVNEKNSIFSKGLLLLEFSKILLVI